MRRQLLALAVVLLIGAIGLLVLTFAGSGDAPGTDPGSTGGFTPPEQGTESTSSGDAGERAPGAGDAAVASGRSVVVVRAEDGKSVPRAEVSILADPAGGAAAQIAALDEGSDPLAWVENHGQTVFADAAGRVELPPFAGSAFVVARKESEIGSIELLSDDPETRVKVAIRAAYPLVVRVVDAGGTPVEGIDVVLFERRPWGPAEIHRVTSRRPDGLARFGDIRWRFGAHPRAEPGVVAVLPLLQPLQESLDLGAPTTRPVRMSIPPTGEVELEVRDPGGEPLEDGTTQVRLMPRGAVGGDGGIADATLQTVLLPVIGSRAVARHVGLGLELVAEVVDTRTGLARPPHTFPGPTRRGERTRRRLAPGGLQPDLTGMLMRPGGGPMAGARVYAQIVPAGSPAGDWSTVRPGLSALCDENGMFRFRPGIEAEELRGKTLRVAREVRVIGGSTEIEETFAIDLPDAFRGPRHDVGEYEVDVEALLASGQVLDGSRQPVADALVSVLLERHGDWVPATDVEVMTDPRGRFRLDGRLPRTRLRLEVMRPGHLQDGIVPFTPGARDLLLRLVRTGSLRGSIRPGSGLTLDAIHVVVSGEAARGVGRGDKISVQPDASGTFRCEGLRPGLATVTVRMHGADENLRRVEGLEIRSGATCEDTRIRELDVASKVVSHKLTIVDRDGAGVNGALVWFRPSGSEVAWRRLRASTSGTCPVPAVGGSLDVMVGGPGRRYSVLEDVREDRRVVMKRAQESHVEVRLAGAVKLPPKPVFIRAQMIWLGPPGQPGNDPSPLSDPRNVSAPQRAFASQRAVSLPVLEPGEYRVQLWVARGEKGGTGTGLPSRSQRVTITETAQRVGVDVSVKLEVLEQLVEAAAAE